MHEWPKWRVSRADRECWSRRPRTQNGDSLSRTSRVADGAAADRITDSEPPAPQPSAQACASDSSELRGRVFRTTIYYD